MLIEKLCLFENTLEQVLFKEMPLGEMWCAKNFQHMSLQVFSKWQIKFLKKIQHQINFSNFIFEIATYGH